MFLRGAGLTGDASLAPDALRCGLRFGIFTVLNLYSSRSLAVEAAFSFPSEG